MIWLLRDSLVDPLELDDDLTDFCRAMAGERATDLTADRENIMAASATEIESYIGAIVFRGVAGAARAATSVVEIDAAGDVPAIGQYPSTHPLTVTAVTRWNDTTSQFSAASYITRPLGVVRLADAGTYQIVASVSPPLTYPIAIGEATARLFAWRENMRPSKSSIAGIGDDSAGLPSTLAGAVMKSGAAEILRHIPRRRR